MSAVGPGWGFDHFMPELLKRTQSLHLQLAGIYYI